MYSFSLKLLEYLQIFLYFNISQSFLDKNVRILRDSHNNKTFKQKCEICSTTVRYSVLEFSSHWAGVVKTKVVWADGATLSPCRMLAVFSHLPVSSCCLQLAARKRRINQCCQITMQIIWSGAGTHSLTNNLCRKCTENPSITLLDFLWKVA